ncbi:hypothetical protein CSIM01_04129 [Colletotrichum simmondsii]|uniref:Uncharacterized protein n=1 Tax=Colletotrichum simmondsii TaxID=703756 RepID=A0A135RNL8_9PEZI|nr:hypothetical protein CSIM01_04129 [Colletotrichum simmondsii]
MISHSNRRRTSPEENGRSQEYGPIVENDGNTQYVYRAEIQETPSIQRESETSGESPTDSNLRHVGEGEPSEHDGLMGDTSNSSLRRKQSNSQLNSIETPNRLCEFDVGSEEKAQVDEGRIWRPDWLRPFVLANFAVFFICAEVAHLIMLCYSLKHGGSFRARSNFTFVWRFGPTAVLTFVASLWARVELQAQRYNIWIILRNRQSVDDADYDLDYTSMMVPTLLYQSLRRKHLLVFLTTLVSLLLKVQIVLVPSLFHLGQAGVSRPTPVRILDVLQTPDDDPGSANSGSSTSALNGSSAYYVARAINNFNLSYPFGVTEEAAHQLFEPRGSTDAPITILVDGFFTDMHCLRLESFEAQPPTSSFDLTLNFEECHHLPHRIQKSNETNWELSVPLNRDRPCRNIPRENPQYIFSALTMREASDSASSTEISAFTAVMCSPTAWTSPIEVVDDGITSRLRTLGSQSKTPHSVNVWAMIERSLPIKFVPSSSLSSTDYSSNHGDFKYGPAGVWAQYQSKAANGHTGLLNTTEALYNSMVGLGRKLGPLAGHYSLRQNQSMEVMGDERRQAEKLKVSYRIGYPMVSIFAVIVSINIFIFIRYREETKLWDRDPATVLGNMLFFHTHKKTVDQNSYFEEKDIDAWRNRARFMPFILRKWVQTAFTVAVLIIIVALLYTMKLSDAEKGLPPTEGNNYLLWTSLPTLIMLGIALYTASFNASLKSLSTLHSLTKRLCRSSHLDNTLLDMLGLRALYTAVRQKAWSISLSQALASLCGVLTTIAATLFTAEPVSRHEEFQLEQDSWFGKRPLEPDDQYYWNNRAFVGSLMLQEGENLTYPENTFRDLAFPSIGDLPISVAKVADDTPVELSLPAATLVARCERQAFNISGTTDDDIALYYDVRIPVTCADGTSDVMEASIVRPSRSTEDSKKSPTAYAEIWGFEESKWSSQSVNSSACAMEAFHNRSVLDSASSVSKVYLWGDSHSSEADLESLQAWQCRY